MAVTINVLNAGNMTLGSSGSTPATRADTRVWFSDGDNDYQDFSIEGELNSTTFQYGPMAYKIEIGSSVTSIGENALSGSGNLTELMIPNSVMSIGDSAFSYCSSLTSVTFLGKTLAQVQEMDNYNIWGIEDTSIINVA